jgi:hypothetical protein
MRFVPRDSAQFLGAQNIQPAKAGEAAQITEHEFTDTPQDNPVASTSAEASASMDIRTPAPTDRPLRVLTSGQRTQIRSPMNQHHHDHSFANGLFFHRCMQAALSSMLNGDLFHQSERRIYYAALSGPDNPYI